ncbi:MAG TPA: TadE family protein [Burkholderiaceae bacterium]|nr:TadE family protein [Burkholderiaceae bacterium]
MNRSSQRGVAAVEFALVASLLFTVLIGVIDMGRLLWMWNAATEATRLGARLAVVCDIGDADIKARMGERLPALTDANITIAYLNPPAADNSCTAATCKAVRVSLTGYTYQTIVPFVPMSIDLPAFSTTLRKEFMSSTGNPVCN